MSKFSYTFCNHCLRECLWLTHYVVKNTDLNCDCCRLQLAMNSILRIKPCIPVSRFPITLNPKVAAFLIQCKHWQYRGGWKCLQLRTGLSAENNSRLDTIKGNPREVLSMEFTIYVWIALIYFTYLVLLGKNVQFSQQIVYVETYRVSTQDSLSISPDFSGVKFRDFGNKSFIQWWGHLRVPFQDAYNMLNKILQRVISEAGHARAYIFEIWRGLEIWNNLFILGKLSNLD